MFPIKTPSDVPKLDLDSKTVAAPAGPSLDVAEFLSHRMADAAITSKAKVVTFRKTADTSKEKATSVFFSVKKDP